MRLSILFAAAVVCSCPAIAQPNYRLMDDSAAPRSDNQQSATTLAPWPVQIEMRVPFEPTAFPSERRIYLMYELHLTNFGTAPRYGSRSEVLDADASAGHSIASFD